MGKKSFLIAPFVLAASLMTGASAVAEEGMRMGIGIVTDISSSKDAGESDGLAEGYAITAAVLLDEEGVIQYCTIDGVQTKINFDKDGKITTDLETEFPSKNELGDDYGMKAASSIGKEWKEQADAFGKLCVGKTIEEVLALELEDGKAVEEDVISSVTIQVSDFVRAIEKAGQQAGAME